MGIVKQEDIIGYNFIRGGNAELICTDCATELEANEATADEILVEDDQSDDLIFCDRCKKRIQG